MRCHRKNHAIFANQSSCYQPAAKQFVATSALKKYSTNTQNSQVKFLVLTMFDQPSLQSMPAWACNNTMRVASSTVG